MRFDEQDACSDSGDVAVLAARVRNLEDREAIRNLIAAYGPSVDRGDAAAAAALWHEDGRYDVGGFGICRGREEIGTLLDGDVHHQLIGGGAAHVLSPVWIDVQGDRAEAAGYSCVFRWTGSAFEVFRVAANRWSFRRGADGWRAEERINRLLDGDDVARALLLPPAAKPGGEAE